METSKLQTPGCRPPPPPPADPSRRPTASTPVPTPACRYSRHTSRMLTIWLSFLPFSLWDACHWWTVPVTGLVAYLLLGEPLLGIFEACQTRVLGHMPRSFFVSVLYVPAAAWLVMLSCGAWLIDRLIECCELPAPPHRHQGDWADGGGALLHPAAG